MIGLELRIHVDDEGPVRAGGRVRGRVEVRAHEEVRCEPLTLRFGWRTEGEGATDAGGQRFVLFTGTLPAGAVQSFPFDLHIPPGGPFTHRGQVVSIAWVLRAEAEVPGRYDPLCEREVIVLPEEPREGEVSFLPPARYGPPNPSLRLDWMSPSPVGMGCLSFIFLTPFLLGGLAGLALWLVPALTGGPPLLDPGAGLAGGALGILLGVFLVRQARKMLALRRLGPVSLQIASPVVMRGWPVRAIVQLQPRGDITLDGITLKLRCTEHATRGPGDRSYTHRRVVHEQEAKMLAPQRLATGVPFRGEVDLTPPDGAYLSFESTHNAVEWQVLARVGVDGWSSGETRMYVRVIP